MVVPNLCGTPAATAAMKCITSCFPVCTSFPGAQLTQLYAVPRKGQLVTLAEGASSSSYVAPTLAQVQKMNWMQFVNAEGVCRVPFDGKPESAKEWLLFRHPPAAPVQSTSAQPAPSASVLVPGSDNTHGDLEAQAKNWWQTMRPEARAVIAISSALLAVLLIVNIFSRAYRAIFRRNASGNAQASPKAKPQPKPNAAAKKIADASPRPKVPLPAPHAAQASRSAMDSKGDLAFRDTIPPPGSAAETIPSAALHAEPATVKNPTPIPVSVPDAPERFSQGVGVMFHDSNVSLLPMDGTPIPATPRRNTLPPQAVLEAIDSFTMDHGQKALEDRTLDLSIYAGRGVKVSPKMVKTASLILFHFYYGKQPLTILRELHQLLEHLVPRPAEDDGRMSMVRSLMFQEVIDLVEKSSGRGKINRDEIDQVLTRHRRWIETDTVGGVLPPDENDIEARNLPASELPEARRVVREFLADDPVYRDLTEQEREMIVSKFVSACHDVLDFASTYYRDGRVTRAGIEIAMKAFKSASEVSGGEKKAEGKKPTW